MGNCKARWDTLYTAENFSGTLAPGIEPSTFSFTVSLPASSRISKSGSIVIGDGNRTDITLLDCRASDGGISWDSTSKTWSVTVRDRRWRWKHLGTISGEYNRRDVAGNIIDAANKKNAQQLATLLLTAMGETGYSVAGLPAGEYPYVEWVHETPALMLSDLCERWNVRICLCTDNIVRLYAPGDGNGPSETLNRETYELREEIVDKPAKMALVGSRNLYQAELTGLTAVGIEVSAGHEGEIVPIASLSYKPAMGWFAGCWIDMTSDTARAGYDKSVFKWYRLPDSITIGSETLTRAEAMRRWCAELVEKATIDGEEKRRAPYAKGKYSTKNQLFDPMAIPDTSEEIKVSFSLNEQFGIIEFSQQVFLCDASTSYKPTASDITLVCAFEGIHFYYEKKTSDGISGHTERIERSDLRREYLNGTLQNGSEVEAKAKEYIDADLEKYETYGSKNETQQSKVLSWAGIHDVSPSGACDEVSWQISSSGIPLTTASYGCEHARKNLPRTERKVRIEQARVIKAVQSVRRTDGPVERLAIDESGFQEGFDEGETE